MAYEETLRRVSLDADSSIGFYTGPPGMPGSTSPNYGKQFTFVKVVSAHTAGAVTAATDPIVGVLQNKPQQVGDTASVATHGISMVMSGAAISAVGTVTVDTSGRAITGSTNVVGMALDVCAGANQLVPVLLKLN